MNIGQVHSNKNFRLVTKFRAESDFDNIYWHESEPDGDGKSCYVYGRLNKRCRSYKGQRAKVGKYRYILLPAVLLNDFAIGLYGLLDSNSNLVMMYSTYAICICMLVSMMIVQKKKNEEVKYGKNEKSNRKAIV